jgi:5-methylcytosine-specific restriction endonuclease McrA
MNLTAIITQARNALFRRHARIFNFERDVLGPHRGTWRKDRVIVRHKQDYQDYLESDHWRSCSAAARRRAGHRCERCGANDQLLNTHHLNYDRLGHERDEDLVVLCEKCHREEHGIDAS